MTPPSSGDRKQAPVTSADEAVKRVVVLCGNRGECVHYMEQYLTDPKNEHLELHASHPYTEVEGPFENVRWVTPDDVVRILGTEVDTLLVQGTANRHMKYWEAHEYIVARLRPRSITRSTAKPKKQRKAKGV